MALHLHRAPRIEHLAAALAENLGAGWPDDPFEAVAVVVGNHGMRRWLQHDLATRLGVATRIEYPTLGQALDGAAARLLGAPREPGAAFWVPAATWGAEAAMPEGLGFHVVRLLRELAAAPTAPTAPAAPTAPTGLRRDDFASAAAYLYPEGMPSPLAPRAVGRRELAFAAQVASVLQALVRDRPETALRWAEAPAEAPAEHAWLAHLLHRLGAAADGAPARVHARLVGPAAGLVVPPDWQALHLFGTSSLGPGDRARVAAIGAVAEVHMYLCLPTVAASTGLADSLGAQAALLTEWAVRVGATVHAGAPPPAAGAPSVAPEPPPAPAFGGLGIDPSTAEVNFEVYSTYGPLRQVELLRDRLLTLFVDDSSLEPRDVLVMTPDVETFAPLIAAAFAQRPNPVAQRPTRGVPQPGAPQAEALQTGAPEPWARPPAVPVTISDLGLARTNPVAEALLTVLALVGERVTAPTLFDLMALSPVRTRFGIDPDALDDIRTLLETSGMRWGEDAEDRRAFGQPALDQNTLRFGLERLALGALMPEADPLGVVAGSAADGLRPAAPADIESPDRIGRIGQIAGVVRTLGHWRRTLGGEGPASDAWRGLLGSVLDAFTETSSAARWLRLEVDTALDTLFAGADALGGLSIGAGSVVAMLRGHFEIEQSGDRVIGSAVVVTGLQPMRPAPFRVVALVGMDDASFPRGGTRPRWDPFATPEPGELDPRAVDRHLLLETLLSTRERLLVFFTGRDAKSGGELPAAVPVEELVDALSAREDTPRKREDVVRTPPLQPWSPLAFRAPAGASGGAPAGASGGAPAGASCPRSFDPAMAQAARLVSEGRERGPVGLSASRDQELPEEDRAPTTLTLDALAAGLAQPQKMLLSERLGLSAARASAVLEDREPLELDTLERWGLRRRAIDALRPDAPEGDAARAIGHPSGDPSGDPLGDPPGDQTARLRARLAAEGDLPLEAGGERLLACAVDEAHAVLALWGAPPDATTSLSVRVGGLLLSGRPPTDVAPEPPPSAAGAPVFGWLTPSDPGKGRGLIVAYVYLLAAVAQGLAVRDARIVGWKGGAAAEVRLRIDRTRSEALTELLALITVWKTARRRPVPLFEQTSWAIASRLDASGAVGDRRALGTAVAAAWQGGKFASGDASDAWVRPLFADFNPLGALDTEGDGALLDLARRVWHPVAMAARAAGAPVETTAGDTTGGEEG